LRKSRCLLQALNLSNNDIGDDGIAAIARALNNSQISILGVCKCGITLTGVKTLARELKINKRMIMIKVWGNAITLEGARLILRSAVDNGVCQQIDIHDELFDRCEEQMNDGEVKKMIAILEQRKKQQQEVHLGVCFMM